MASTLVLYGQDHFLAQRNHIYQIWSSSHLCRNLLIWTMRVLRHQFHLQHICYQPWCRSEYNRSNGALLALISAWCLFTARSWMRILLESHPIYSRLKDPIVPLSTLVCSGKFLACIVRESFEISYDWALELFSLHDYLFLRTYWIWKWLGGYCFSIHPNTHVHMSHGRRILLLIFWNCRVRLLLGTQKTPYLVSWIN